MKTQITTLANGCFWCTEAVFKRLKGVISVEPGYSGGMVENPTYEQVSSGDTGHAESIRIEFNPDIISFKTILDVFWYTHDPTTLNQQGNDIGTQYRSVIFYHDEKQKEEALKSKLELEKERIYKDPIVTEITPFINFYEAENYHKDYFDKNKEYPYCRFVINPKLKKLLEKYSDRIKEEYKA
jgi:peptide-methionine (S)-S-oxide reductase